MSDEDKKKSETKKIEETKKIDFSVPPEKPIIRSKDPEPKPTENPVKVHKKDDGG